MGDRDLGYISAAHHQKPSALSSRQQIDILVITTILRLLSLILIDQSAQNLRINRISVRQDAVYNHPRFTPPLPPPRSRRSLRPCESDHNPCTSIPTPLDSMYNE